MDQVPPNGNGPFPLLIPAALILAPEERGSGGPGLGLLAQGAPLQTQWSRAQNLTGQALVLAAAVNAPDITHRWQEQLGRILEARNDLTGAIAPLPSRRQ